MLEPSEGLLFQPGGPKCRVFNWVVVVCYTAKKTGRGWTWCYLNRGFGIFVVGVVERGTWVGRSLTNDWFSEHILNVHQDIKTRHAHRLNHPTVNTNDSLVAVVRGLSMVTDMCYSCDILRHWQRVGKNLGDAPSFEISKASNKTKEGSFRNG